MPGLRGGDPPGQSLLLELWACHNVAEVSGMDQWEKARENALRHNAEDLRLILAEEKATT